MVTKLFKNNEVSHFFPQRREYLQNSEDPLFNKFLGTATKKMYLLFLDPEKLRYNR